MDEVGANEMLARFLTQSNHFKSPVVKPKAFMPNPYDDLSVSRVSNLSNEEIEPLGRVAISNRHCMLYGWALVEASQIRAKGLTVKPKEPPERHAIIEGWPADKEDRKGIAQELAAAASLALLALG